MITLEMKSCLVPKRIAIFSTVWFIAFSIVAVIPSSTPAQDNPQVPGRLLVGVADFPPYTVKTEDGKWEGVSIELWQAVVVNNIDAFVDDACQLRYIVINEFRGKLRVLPETLAHIYVSMAIPSGSPLREPLNRALAKVIDSDDWIELKERYMGRIH